MECIIAYALLALFVDLLHEIITTDVSADEAQWISRRLWGDTLYDCRTVKPSDRLLTRTGLEPKRPSRSRTYRIQGSRFGFARALWKCAGNC